MKKLFLIACLLFPSLALANPYDLRAIRVIDGDTIEIDAPFLPKELRQVLRLRIIDVDTPEKGSLAKCDSERQLAENASRFTTRLVMSAKRQQVVFVKWDKYGGRVLGDMLVDGRSVRELLLASPYARPYDGGKKSNWCR